MMPGHGYWDNSPTQALPEREGLLEKREYINTILTHKIKVSPFGGDLEGA
ncbi:hypothetical protein ABIB39_000519 [Mucilaginibacter sp. UYP27]